MKSRTSLAAILAAALAIGAGCGPSGRSGPAAGAVRHVAEPAVRADVVATIAASGTLEPVELVDVGSQVSGKIVAFGTDADGAEVDYCSIVTNGMVLARIDDVTYLADLDVARAQLANAEASVASARAGEAKSRIDLDHARKDWDRARRSASASRSRRATSTPTRPRSRARRRSSASPSRRSRAPRRRSSRRRPTSRRPSATSATARSSRPWTASSWTAA